MSFKVTTRNLYMMAHLKAYTQSEWQLAAIQLMGVVSLPVITSSVLLIFNHSFISAVANICIGNIILWIIRRAMLEASFDRRENALEVAQHYLGTMGIYLLGFFLFSSTVLEYVLQTNIGALAIGSVIPRFQGASVDVHEQYMALLGILSVVFCIGGMRSLKWLAMVTLPFLLLCLFVLAFICSPENLVQTEGTFSLSGIGLILGINLSTVVEQPTFFRHSRDKRSCIRAITIIQLTSLFVAMASLYLLNLVPNINAFSHVLDALTGQPLLQVGIIGLFIVSIIAANTAMVYSVSIVIELVFPDAIIGYLEYAILGWSLTTISLLIPSFNASSPMQIVGQAMVSFCLVIVLEYFSNRILQHRARIKTASFAIWLISIVIGVVQVLIFDIVQPGLFVSTVCSVGVLSGVLFFYRATAKQ